MKHNEVRNNSQNPIDFIHEGLIKLYLEDNPSKKEADLTEVDLRKIKKIHKNEEKVELILQKYWEIYANVEEAINKENIFQVKKVDLKEIKIRQPQEYGSQAGFDISVKINDNYFVSIIADYTVNNSSIYSSKKDLLIDIDNKIKEKKIINENLNKEIKEKEELLKSNSKAIDTLTLLEMALDKTEDKKSKKVREPK